MSLTTRVLIGLVAGFLVGLANARYPSSAGVVLVTIAEPVGTIFINLIRMTAIPLVVSLLIVSIGSLATSSTLGRAAWKAAAVMVVLLVVAAAISLAVAQPVLARLYPSALRPGSGFGATGVTPGSFVHSSARLERGVTVDPGAVVGPGAEIGRGLVARAGDVEEDVQQRQIARLAAEDRPGRRRHEVAELRGDAVRVDQRRPDLYVRKFS